MLLTKKGGGRKDGRKGQGRGEEREGEEERGRVRLPQTEKPNFWYGGVVLCMWWNSRCIARHLCTSTTCEYWVWAETPSSSSTTAPSTDSTICSVCLWHTTTSTSLPLLLFPLGLNARIISVSTLTWTPKVRSRPISLGRHIIGRGLGTGLRSSVPILVSDPKLRTRGVVGRGRGGTASPPLFSTLRTRPPLPHFFGLKFVQKLVYCCNRLLTETQCKIISVQQD